MHKDFKILVLRGSGILQSLLLGLLLIFVFSLSKSPGEYTTPQTAMALFWLASSFCQILTFNMLYSLEEKNNTWAGLLLIPQQIQSIWLGKALTGLFIIIVTQLMFFPATLIFLNQTMNSNWGETIGTILLVDIGLVTLGSLLGAISQGQASRESLLSIILFPLMIPLLLAGINSYAYTTPPGTFTENSSWLKLILAFDSIFLSAGFLLFPFMFTGSD